MSTILELIDDELLIPFEPELMPGDMPFRRIAFAPEFIEWIEKELASLPGGTRQIPLAAELEQVLEAFVRGEKLTGDINKITPEAGLWKIQTPNLRLCGAIIERGYLVLFIGRSSKELHGKGSASKYADIHRTIRHRLTELNLKAMVGERHEVL